MLFILLELHDQCLMLTLRRLCRLAMSSAGYVSYVVQSGLDWSSCAMPEWWRMQLGTHWFNYGAGCVPDGFKETSTKERWKTHPAYWFTADAPQDIARARHCGRCNALLHLCSNRFVCCMVLHQRISDRWGRACTRRSDRDWNRKWIHNRVWIHAQPAKKP